MLSVNYREFFGLTDSNRGKRIMSEATKTIAKVRALRDFTVGPGRKVAIQYGAEREVVLMDGGIFCTYPDSKSGFFGYCKLDNGWELLSLREVSIQPTNQRGINGNVTRQ